VTHANVGSLNARSLEKNCIGGGDDGKNTLSNEELDKIKRTSSLFNRRFAAAAVETEDASTKNGRRGCFKVK
jgi:hypothetical protein